MIPRVVVAGTSSGVGKTTIATGLMAALVARGRRVAGFKVGPDFIDPTYHALATGRAGRNLDAFLSGPQLIAPLFAAGAAGADVAVVEGVMGLFDGVSGREELASTAHVAKLLRAPVVLVVDASAMARSIAAMVHGYATFDPGLAIAGVIANRVGSQGHASLLREALQPLGLPLLGALPRDDALAVPSRHLGLVPVAERRAEAGALLAPLAASVARHVDLEALLRVADSAPRLHAAPWQPPSGKAHGRIAVATGPAFTFAYAENLEALRAAGADLHGFDPLRDEALPAGTQALYLVGGFPEAHAPALSANVRLRRSVAAFRGPVVAECGGLLYLCRALEGSPMCGVVPAAATRGQRLTLGYREATAAATSPLWRIGERVCGHEFHRWQLDPAHGATPAWRSRAGADGFVSASVHAAWLHTHWAATPHIARRFAAAAARTEVAACA